MRPIGILTVWLLACAASATAQDTREQWKVGVTAAAGIPSGLGGIRVGAPMGNHAGIDLAVARLTGWGDMDLGPAYITHVRWTRGGRSPSGDSRYWIFGALFMNMTSTTTVVYPGNVRHYLVERDTVGMPRFGYGWDHVTRRGTRVGLELTTGAAGEQAALMLANVIVMWGPPKK